MSVSIIVAIAEGGVIGRDGKLPWHLPADLARFKRLTMGHTILMGRRTYQSIGRPLPGRQAIVLSRSTGFRPAGVQVAADWEQALRAAPADRELFAIGGVAVYRLALPIARRLYITRVHQPVAGDVLFPTCDFQQWHLRERTPRPADERNPLSCTFEVWERRVTHDRSETP